MDQGVTGRSWVPTRDGAGCEKMGWIMGLD